jgi:membrane-associated phospholipid phosphatase
MIEEYKMEQICQEDSEKSSRPVSEGTRPSSFFVAQLIFIKKFQNYVPAWLASVFLFLHHIVFAEMITFSGLVLYYLGVPIMKERMPLANWGVCLGLGELINGVIKFCFQEPRPLWHGDWVKNPLNAFNHDYSFPSSHSQSLAGITSAFYFTVLSVQESGHPGLMEDPGTIAVCVLFLVATVLSGISRVYLAAHFPSDVLIGWILGFIIPWIFLRKLVWGDFMLRQSVGVGFLYSLLLPLGSIACLIGAIALFPTDKSKLAEWQSAIDSKFNQEEGKKKRVIVPRKLSFYFLITGFLFGLSWSFPLSSTIEYEMPMEAWQRVCRLVVGFAGIAVLSIPIVYVQKKKPNFENTVVNISDLKDQDHLMLAKRAAMDILTLIFIGIMSVWALYLSTLVFIALGI